MIAYEIYGLTGCSESSAESCRSFLAFRLRCFRTQGSAKATATPEDFIRVNRGALLNKVELDRIVVSPSALLSDAVSQTLSSSSHRPSRSPQPKLLFPRLLGSSSSRCVPEKHSARAIEWGGPKERPRKVGAAGHLSGDTGRWDGQDGTVGVRKGSLGRAGERVSHQADDIAKALKLNLRLVHKDTLTALLLSSPFTRTRLLLDRLSPFLTTFWPRKSDDEKLSTTAR